MTAILFALVFLFGILFPLVLYVAIENETSDPQVMDRAEAERRVQRQSGVDQSHSRGPVRQGALNSALHHTHPLLLAPDGQLIAAAANS